MNRFLFLVAAGILAFSIGKSVPEPLLVGIDPQGNKVYYSKSTDKETPNYISGVYSGQKYECVEYVRRWMIKTWGITFPGVRDATDFLSLTNAEIISTGQKVALTRVDKLSPKVGDVLVYSANRENDHFGHVAVVVRVHKDRVDIGEQNHSNVLWDKDYSRSIPIVNGILSDKSIKGIVRLMK